MSALAIFKLLKTAKDVHDYVKKPNNLDQQNEMILNRLNKLEDDNILLKNKAKQHDTKANRKRDKKWYDE